jgi:hypothetical protein
MHLIDIMGVTLLVLSVAAFAFGQMALARSDDGSAIYWLLVGVAGMTAAVQITRPGRA